MKMSEIRRETRRLVLLSTLAFALLLALGLWLSRELPGWREARLQTELSAGNSRAARRLAGRITDTEKRADYLRACDYLDAQALMAQERWEEAAALLAALGEYEDASALYADCRYRTALSLLEAGEHAGAAEIFLRLGTYRDAAEQVLECRYREALAAQENGAAAEAALLFAALGDYRDAPVRAAQLACALTGLLDAKAALAQISGLSAEDLARREALAEARGALPTGRIAVGFAHTLGCRSDGGVLACGDDSYGQCGTGSWTEITAVAAGAYHSLGLRRDGTVVAAGRSEEGQCEVSGWTQIVAIAAGDYASYGLRADGTLLCAGLGNFSAAETWNGLSLITAGSYELGALRADGSALLAPGAISTEGLTGLVALAVNTGCAVGLKGDGLAVSPQLELEGWTDVLALSLSGTRLLGVTEQGRLRCLSFRPSDALPLEDLENVAAVSDGGTHAAVLFSDGSVRVFGQTDQGQGDTQSWKLF